jgi:hypothetical protein
MCSKLSVDQLYFFQVRADEHVPRRVFIGNSLPKESNSK